jgi:hypothetical protein
MNVRQETTFQKNSEKWPFAYFWKKTNIWICDIIERVLLP